MAAAHDDLVLTPKAGETRSPIQSPEKKKSRSESVPKSLPLWALQFLKVEREPSPLDVFDIGEGANLVAQLMTRRERAQRQGKKKMVQKLDKEIAAAKVDQTKKAKELGNSVHNSLLGCPEEEVTDDERWDEICSSEPPSEPPYLLVTSTVHPGFLELSARREPLQHVKEPRHADRLGVTVLGESGTPACGLTVDGCLWRKTTIMSIGLDGWRDIGITPKLTASTFVLLGGQFLKPKDGSESSFSSAVGDLERSVLISSARAIQLADELVAAGRPVTGLLEYVCEHRMLCSDSDVQPSGSFVEVFDIGDAPEADEGETQETPRDYRF